jgi:hypothetical protein
VTAAQFLETVYALGSTDAAMDTVMERMDDLFIAGEFDEAGRVLDACDVNRLEADLILTFATVSNWAREKLPGRRAFLDRAEKRLVELVGVEQMEKLMQNMRSDAADRIPL